MLRVPDQICPRCGRFKDIATESTGGVLCRECRRQPSPVSQMRAPMQYQEPLSRIIHRFKYEGYFALAGPLATLIIDGWPVWEHAPDLILPIPLHPRRRRQRGYNQSELLARSLSRELGIVLDTTALRRTRHTAPQVGLGPVERHDNVRGAFSAAAGVRDRHVLLIDDVLTTGATMRSAAETLLAAGATTVSAYCLARVG